MLKCLLLPLLLVGCTSVPPVIKVTELPKYHPSLPIPYAVCPVYWEVLEQGGKAKIALSYNDNVTAAICNNDIERYISQLINITCHYRYELKESICLETSNK